MNFKNNLTHLISQAYKYQYAGISDSKEVIKRNKPKLFFSWKQYIFILLSLVLSAFLDSGFNSNFAGYVISGLSLFVGMFFTFLIFLYDKFKATDFTQYYKRINADLFPLGVRLINFYKKVTVLSLYSIIISILCILLLSVSLLFDNFFSQEISICLLIRNEGFLSYKIIIIKWLIFAYRSITLYFLFDFILIAVYLISSFYDFIVSEYQKIKLH